MKYANLAHCLIGEDLNVIKVNAADVGAAHFYIKASKNMHYDMFILEFFQRNHYNIV